MLVAWIIQSIDSYLRSTIIDCATVKQLSENLYQWLSIDNIPHILQLRVELTPLDQNGQSVVAYYNIRKKNLG